MANLSSYQFVCARAIPRLSDSARGIGLSQSVDTAAASVSAGHRVTIAPHCCGRVTAFDSC